MKVLSLFSGIGAFEQALKNLGIDFDLVGFCEIDKHAARSYCAIHDVPESMNLGDITRVDETKLPKGIDIATYGFPCQDISICWTQNGLVNADGTLTRSGLFFHALRIIGAVKPKIAIAENVKNLVGKKFNAQFRVVLASLEAAGYNNYYIVLNSKDYGVPQNRERVFIVSVRKDIDHGLFQFPKPFPLEKRLRDIMEDRVDEKYYCDGKYESIVMVNENYAMLCGGTIGRMTDIYRRAYNPDYISPTIHTCPGGNTEPKVIVNEPVCLNSKGGRGGVPGLQPSLQDRVYDSNAISTAVTTCFMPWFTDGSRVRKLTPKECFRLMGFDDESFHKAEAVNSKSQLYKQAGNSIVVDVLEAIFRQLLDSDGKWLV
jgi:DNA (cytosine-5)-methyltransferase 1